MVPSLQGDKPSAIQILIKAKEYIEELHTKSQKLEEILSSSSSSSSTTTTTISTPTPTLSTTTVAKKEKEKASSSPSVKQAKEKGKAKVKLEDSEADSLKKENLELKAKIVEIQKKLENLSKTQKERSPNVQQMVIPSSKSQTVTLKVI